MWSKEISRNVYYRDWNPSAANVFNPKLRSIYRFMKTQNDTPFQAVDWHLLMLPNEMCNEALYCHFDEPEEEKNEPDCHRVRDEDRKIWRALMDTIREVGDWDFVCTNFSIILTNNAANVGCAALFNLDEPTKVESNFANELFSLSPIAFGKSERWASISFWDPVMLLGGDREFIDAFVARCGGIKNIQQRYLNYIEREVVYSDDQQFYDSLSDRIGWPRPKYEETVPA
jgi:hypothetical protein